MTANHQTESTVMQIGEAAKRTSLTVDAIRFYEQRKLLPKAVRSAGRFRLYGAGTIERLHFIQQMQGLGFSLREVGELIRLRERKVDACESVKELLRAKLTGVRAKLQELRHLESELEMDLRKCDRVIEPSSAPHGLRLPGARRDSRGESMRIEILYVLGCPNY
jgi:MerR family copper efflux transcriptional regulator